MPDPPDVTAFASQPGTTGWPQPDGVVSLESPSRQLVLAVEYKRPQEGIHGMLTGLGQAHAYLHKGYAGAALVVPTVYPTHSAPGSYLRNVIDMTSPAAPIGVFIYDAPDSSRASPFAGKLACARPFAMRPPGTTAASQIIRARTETQWAHLREGSSTRDGFYRYLQIAKRLPLDAPREPGVQLPRELLEAAARLRSAIDPLKFLSNTADDSPSSLIWRHFWFTWVAHRTALRIWRRRRTGPYVVNDEPTRLTKDDRSGRQIFFAGRSDSIKNRTVESLNSGAMSEDQAWESFAVNVRSRAHSLREDIDSGLAHLGLIEPDGRPSDLGYRFVDVCERSGDPNTGTPAAILGAAILQNGRLGAFLHYVYRASEEVFRENPRAYITTSGGRERFDQSAYLEYLESRLADELKVLRKVPARGGVARRPLQAELALLRHYNFVAGFRFATGLEIDWVRVQDAMTVEL